MKQKHLLALATGGFGIGLTEFVIMGLLTNVAAFFGRSIPETGHLISFYALGVVIGAPILTLIGNRFSAKSYLIFLMYLFALFNGLSAFATDFEWLKVFRFLAGLPHGAFFGIAVVVATRLAPKGKENSSIATVFVGLTLANVVGVPFATWLGGRFGWQWAFALVSLIAVLTMILVRAWVPNVEMPPRNKLLHEFRIFKRLDLWLCIVMCSIGFGGFFAWISYIRPLLTDVSGFSPDSIPLLMGLIGIGMTIGTVMGGRVADRLPETTAALIFILAVMFTLSAHALLAGVTWIVPVLLVAVPACAMASFTPVNSLLIRYSAGSENLGAALGQSSFNIGNSVGAFMGGLPLVMGYSYRSPLWVGVCLCSTRLALILVLRYRERQSLLLRR